MATSNRFGLIESENGSTNYLSGKTLIKKETNGLQRRQALGEIKNQISNRDNVKKQNSITQKIIKPTTVTTTVVNNKEVTKKETKNKITIKLNSLQSSKLIESKINSIVTKIETECVIKQDEQSKGYSTKRFEIEEDEETAKDPQFVSEYTNEIFDYLRSLELKSPVQDTFLSYHRTTIRMRCVLINWLVEVHLNFKMYTETMHLCVAILDRYLQKNTTIGRETLQLVGITSLFIAAKYEEMYTPEVNDYIYVGDDSFTKTDLMKMELAMLKCLDFNFGLPLSIHFLRRYSKIGKIDTYEHVLGKYLLELAFLESELSSARPSKIAAAANFLSCSVLRNITSANEIWTSTMINCSTYTFAEIEKIVAVLAKAVVKAETSKYKAIRNKYASSNCGKISMYPELKGPVIAKYSQK